MTQNIGHVFETGATVDHLGSHRMPEDMAGDARGTTIPARVNACRTMAQTAALVNDRNGGRLRTKTWRLSL